MISDTSFSKGRKPNRPCPPFSSIPPRPTGCQPGPEPWWSASLPTTDCGMNVHHKCQMKVANLCGINQKLLAEALNQVSQVGRHCGEPVQRVLGLGPVQAHAHSWGVNCSEGHLYQRPHFWKIHFKVWSLESGGLVLLRLVIQAVLWGWTWRTASLELLELKPLYVCVVCVCVFGYVGGAWRIHKTLKLLKL